MFKRIKFYKENDKWYADVKNRTKEENEMVSGADTFLEYISDGHSKVHLCINQDAYHDHFASLYREKHDDYGATYLIRSEDLEVNRKHAWLCNVTHDVLGEHPEYFFIDILYPLK